MSCLSWWLLHFGEISPGAMMLVVVEPPYGDLVSRKAAPHTATAQVLSQSHSNNSQLDTVTSHGLNRSKDYISSEHL